MAKNKQNGIPPPPKRCFVMMPISDVSGYDNGHFKRVYEHLIKPACDLAGFIPVRADDVANTNHIVIDILKNILECEMVLCDLSARNPNVMYELGIRQAFNMPAVLIKDGKSDDIFDIQGLRYCSYDENLRVDKVTEDIIKMSQSIIETYDKKDKDFNSIIQLLGVKAAELSDKTELSGSDSLLFNAINDISKRLRKLEPHRKNDPSYLFRDVKDIEKNRHMLSDFIGKKSQYEALHKQYYLDGKFFGVLAEIDENELYTFIDENGDPQAIHITDPLSRKLSLY